MALRLASVVPDSNRYIRSVRVTALNCGLLQFGAGFDTRDLKEALSINAPCSGFHCSVYLDPVRIQTAPQARTQPSSVLCTILFDLDKMSLSSSGLGSADCFGSLAKKGQDVAPVP
jgi:hypothetical protein